MGLNSRNRPTWYIDRYFLRKYRHVVVFNQMYMYSCRIKSECPRFARAGGIILVRLYHGCPWSTYMYRGFEREAKSSKGYNIILCDLISLFRYPALVSYYSRVLRFPLIIIFCTLGRGKLTTSQVETCTIYEKMTPKSFFRGRY